MKRVCIANYQSIAFADLELDPGVNLLLGSSDSGKSAFVRALRDACFNATADGAVRVGEKQATVTLDAVAWEKGKNINAYTVGVQPFDKVGRSVPEQVSEELGIREVEFGEGVKRKIQFAQQFDRHFMINESPSDNAKILGALGDLHVVYNAIREGQRQLSATRKSLEAKAAEEAENEAEAEVLGKELQSLEKAARIAQDRLSTYQATLTWYQGLVATEQALDDLAVNLAALTSQKHQIDAQAVEHAGATLVALKDRSSKLEASEALLASLKAQRGARPEGIEEHGLKLKDLLEMREGLLSQAQEMKTMIKHRGDIEKSLTTVRQELSQVEACPLCGGQFKCAS